MASTKKASGILTVILLVIIGALVGWQVGNYFSKPVLTQLAKIEVLHRYIDFSAVEDANLSPQLRTIKEAVVTMREFYFKKLELHDILNSVIISLNYTTKKEKLQGADITLLKPEKNEVALFNKFAKKYEELLKKSKGKVDPHLYFESAMIGIALTTADPHTLYLPIDFYKSMQEQLGNENYGGVGIYLETDRNNHNQLTVIEPIEGTPAERSGIKTGDLIMDIDQKSTKKMDIEAASLLIRGKIGSTVTLKIERPGKGSFVKKLVRESIHVRSTGCKMVDKDIGYIRVKFFGLETSTEFAQDLQKLEKQGAKSVILDLRNNGGGYVDAAVHLVGNFIEKGKVVTSIVTPRTGRDDAYKVDTRNYTKLPLAVIINRFSASASEIVAGAIQDYKRGIIVGERSYGKGSVQSVYELDDGSALKITIAHYLTPHNKDINLKGIEPDVKLESLPTNFFAGPNDKQLKAAINALRGKK